MNWVILQKKKSINIGNNVREKMKKYVYIWQFRKLRSIIAQEQGGGEDLRAGPMCLALTLTESLHMGRGLMFLMVAAY